MRTKITTAFPHSVPKACISVDNRKEIIIYDDTVKCRSCIFNGGFGAAQRPYLKILNPKQKDITIVAIDNCILNAEDGKKCDFACFDEKDFYFVELKLAAGGKSSKRLSRQHALLQLKETINIFRGSIDFSGYIKYACSCVGYHKTTPAATAADLNNRLDFINNCDNTHLIQGDQITFN